MFYVFFKLDFLVKSVNYPVYFNSYESAFTVAFKILLEFAFSTPYNRRVDVNFTAFRHSHYFIDYLVNRLPRNFPTALRAMRHAEPRVQKTEIIVNFRHRSHGRTRVVVCGFLVDCNSRRKPLYLVHVRLCHLS